MSTKQLKELKGLTQDERKIKLREIERQLFDARMKKATGQLTDSASIWRLRKSMARLKTIESQGLQS